MSITRKFDLRLTAGKSIPLVINANQYDSGEQWVFTLHDDNGEQYTPSTGAIVGIKSDNLGIINTASVVGGNVVVNETQQMTAAVGKAVFELLIDDQTHGTANFIVLVEPKPGDQADLSESDLSLIQQAIDHTSPAAIAQGVADWMADNLTPTTPVVDASLTVQGAAADAKKTGDEISELKSQIATGGLTEDVKQALLACFEKVAWIDTTGQTLVDALEDALYPPAQLTSITAVYTQSGTVYNTDSLDSLKSDLVVTANYDDGTSETVTTYTLSGTLEEGTSTIVVTYEDKTASFNVTVTDDTPLYPLANGTWTSGNGNRSIVVTNGNHISYTNNSASTSGTGIYGNLSNCSSNGTNGTENANFNHAQIFTIPANSEVEFSFTPTALSGLSTQDGNNIALYKANSTTVIGAGTSAKFTTQTTIGEKITASFTVAEATNIGSISMYARNLFSRVEGDIELRVNGTRYI